MDSNLKNIEVVCKTPGCGAVFLISGHAQLTDMTEGRSASSRCRECRQKYKLQTTRAGLGYVSVRQSATSSPLIAQRKGEVGLGRLNADRPSPKVGDYAGKPIPDEGKKYEKAAPYMDELIRTLTDPDGERFVLVSLPTGFGKSTYMMYRLLMSELAERGTIWVTEPRLSVLHPHTPCGSGTLPWYVGKQLLQAPDAGYGRGQLVGVKYRGSHADMYDESSNRLVYCSDGILIRKLMGGDLDSVSCIVIDEAHEMSENMCSLFTMLRGAIALYPQLRVVFASATVDPAEWQRFYAPQTVRVIKPEGEKTQFLPIINFPEATPSDCVELAPLYAQRFGYGSKLPGFKAIEKPADICELAPLVIKGIRDGIIGELGNRYGDIVIFVPSERLVYELEEAVTALQLPDLEIFPRHGKSDKEEQAAFEASEERIKKLLAQIENEFRGNSKPTTGEEKYAELNRRKRFQRVIIGTNYLETGVTMTVFHVIEAGYQFERPWDTTLCAHVGRTVRTSLDKLMQRWGRIARVASGEVWCLYSRENVGARPTYSAPSITKTNLDKLLLTILQGGLHSIVNLEIFGVDRSLPEHCAELERAQREIIALGAMDHFGRLTDVGAFMEGVQTSTANAAALLLWAEAFGYGLEIATFLAYIDVSSQRILFSLSPEGMVSFERFRHGCKDDLEFALRVMFRWAHEKARHGDPAARTWVERHGMELETLEAIEKRRGELLRNFELGTHFSQSRRLFDFRRLDQVRAGIARAMKEWIFRFNSQIAQYEPAFRECPLRMPASIDRDSSVISGNTAPLVVCLGRQGTRDQIFMSHVVVIAEEWLPSLEAKDDISLLLAVNGGWQRTQHDIGSLDRITMPLLRLGDVGSYRLGGEYRFRALAKQNGLAHDETWYFVEDLSSHQFFPATLPSSDLAPGEEFRAIVVGVTRNSHLLELSQEEIARQLCAAGHVVKDAPVRKVFRNPETGLIESVLWAIEPGISGRTYRDSYLGAEAFFDLLQPGPSAMAVRCERVSRTGRLYVEPIWRFLKKPLDEVIAVLQRERSTDDGEILGWDFRLGPGLSANLHPSELSCYQITGFTEGKPYRLQLIGIEAGRQTLCLPGEGSVLEPREGTIHIARVVKLHTAKQLVPQGTPEVPQLAQKEGVSGALLSIKRRWPPVHLQGADAEGLSRGDVVFVEILRVTRRFHPASNTERVYIDGRLVPEPPLPRIGSVQDRPRLGREYHFGGAAYLLPVTIEVLAIEEPIKVPVAAPASGAILIEIAAESEGDDDFDLALLDPVLIEIVEVS